MQAFQEDHSLDSYVQKLIGFGVQVNKKLMPAIFFLKNGLRYPGLLTTESIQQPETLVDIPLDLVLTSHRALRQPELEQVYEDKFYKEGPLWQDRILVTYLLFLLSSKKQCIWYEMVKMFSKQIDIVSFWDEQDIQNFIDKSVNKAAKKELNHFQQQWKRFQQLKQQYQILNNEYFSKQNYKWIYIHTVSRCFGSFLNSTYFVPYCQLFNHSPVNVSYCCYNKHKTINDEEKEEASQSESQNDTISSGYSEDYLSDDDFDYMSINSYTIKWNSKISYDLKEKQNKVVQNKLKELYDWIDKELEWKGFTLIYLGQIIEKLKIIENQYKAGRKKYQQTVQKIEQTRFHVYAYRKYLVEFYKSEGKQYRKTKDQRRVQSNFVKNTSWANYQKSKDQCKQQYTHFKMQALVGAKFQKDSQIYFSYGKLSNRTLLVRYGFCLENNYYDHVWIKFSLGRSIEAYPDLFDSIQSKGLPVNFKTKLKSFKFAIQPIILMRVKKWKLTHHTLEDIFYITDLDRQMDAIEKVIEVYQIFYEKYKDYQEVLTSQSSYHQYFSKVYNLEKKNILERQIALCYYVLQLLKEMKDKKQISIDNIEIRSEYKKYLKNYLKGFRGLMKR